ncbi:MAG: hypothetical protein LQ346_007096 [Caloplaca aetnensis]|nr:MAG: hypothetical protein LQ346_007096 [Caloplaca aetnensis]
MTEMDHGAPRKMEQATTYGFSEGTNPIKEDAVKSIQRTAVSSSLSDRFRASNYWIRKSISIHQPEIIVFENKTKRFTLVPDQNLLEHEEEGNPGYDFFTITWKPTSKPEETTNIFTTYEADDGAFVPVVTNPDMTQTRIFSMRSTASDRPLPCVFVALGWLRERDLPSKSEGGGMQTTYYVVLLNLSTDPVSVWLMFDYHLQADDVCLYRWTNRLGDYHNRRWSPEFGKGALLPKSDDLFPGPPTADVVNRLRHLLHERSNRHRAFDTPSEHGAESVPQANGFHKRDSSASSSQGSTLVDDADNHHVPIDKLGKNDTGYFGLPRHDLALLAPDIMAWSGQGFPAEQVVTCLRGTHVHLGSSLRARSATDEEIDSIKQNRVNFANFANFANLGFS